MPGGRTTTGLVTLTALSPRTVSDGSEADGVQIDVKGFEGVDFIIQSGTLGEALAVTIQERAKTSDAWADVADADLIGTEAGAGFTDAEDNAVHRIAYIGNKRYTRIQIDPGAAACTFGVVALMFGERWQPQRNQDGSVIKRIP